MAQDPALPLVLPAASPVAGEVERLFREHNDSLLRFITAKLGSSQEAREIAQEAYVRLLSLDRTQEIGYLRAFLFKIATNLAIDRLRQRSRRQFVVAPEQREATVFEFTPDRQLEGEQTLKRLSDAIEELPQKCREAILLYRLEGLSCKEVAQRLGLQERMAWLYIARALEHMRAKVFEAAGESTSRSRT